MLMIGVSHEYLLDHASLSEEFAVFRLLCPVGSTSHRKNIWLPTARLKGLIEETFIQADDRTVVKLDAPF